MSQADHSSESVWLQTLVGVFTLVVAVAIAIGALGISSDAGYSGVGPNFLPWLVALGLGACGLLLLREARSGGFRQLEPGSGAGRGDWIGFAWVSAGLLLNAALITTIGFVLGCALCFVLAVRGFRHATGQPGHGLRTLVFDAVLGIAISAPVYWMFTKLLSVSLPGLTETGWI